MNSELVMQWLARLVILAAAFAAGIIAGRIFDALMIALEQKQ